jgi:hypothetical protein
MPHARVPHGSYVIVAGRNRPLKEGLDTKATRPHSLLLSGNACCATGGNWLLSTCLLQICQIAQVMPPDRRGCTPRPHGCSDLNGMPIARMSSIQ